MRSFAELLPLLSIVALAATAVVVTIAVAVRRHHGAAFFLTLLGLAVAFALLLVATPGTPIQVSPLIVMDSYAHFFIGLLILTSLAVVLLSGRYLRGWERHIEEYYILLLTATLGATILVTASHFVSFFLGIELLSVSLYGLIAYMRTRAESTEAGLKYLILAAASSAMLLFGMALIYARLGTMEFALLAPALGAAVSPTGAWVADPAILAGAGLLAVGFGFKLAVVPFHMWTPDIYQGAPAPITAFVAAASKGAVMALLLRFAVLLDLSPGGPLWLLFALISGASMIVGNLLALLQKNLKRLLAYSSIAHLGYLLVAFLARGAEASQAVVFYLVGYTVTTLGAFGVITVLSAARETTRDLDMLSDYRGLGRRRPWLAGVLTAMLLSLAGIPLTAGYVGKFLLLAAGVGSALWALVVLLAVNSAIGIYYYLRVIVALYLQPADAPSAQADADATSAEAAVPAVSLAGGTTLAILTILLVWLGVYPNPVMHLIRKSCAGLF